MAAPMAPRTTATSKPAPQQMPPKIAPLVGPASEWIEANDYIYWRNGICDRTYYDASLFNARVHSVPPEDVTIGDNTHWARFVEPRPRHVLRFDGALEFMISPWFNV